MKLMESWNHGIMKSYIFLITLSKVSDKPWPKKRIVPQTTSGVGTLLKKKSVNRSESLKSVFFHFVQQ